MVKKLITRRQSAEISYKNNDIFQRLSVENLKYAWLVGLIEGDGYFSITKNGKYLKYIFGIELHIRDIKLLYKIKNLLGVGTIHLRNTKNRTKTATFKITNKSHLKNIVLPIFDKYSLLTNKNYDYLRFKNFLLKDGKYSLNLPYYIRPNIDIYTVENILNKNYFSSWLIGFIEAESCFSIYNNKVATFEITQTNGKIIILAIKNYLSLTPNITKDNTNNYKIKVSNIRSIENIIKFIHKAPVKLVGYKKLQYLLWLKKIRTILTYTKKFNIPNNY